MSGQLPVSQASCRAGLSASPGAEDIYFLGIEQLAADIRRCQIAGHSPRQIAARLSSGVPSGFAYRYAREHRLVRHPQATQEEIIAAGAQRIVRLLTAGLAKPAGESTGDAVDLPAHIESPTTTSRKDKESS